MCLFCWILFEMILMSWCALLTTCESLSAPIISHPRPLKIDANGSRLVLGCSGECGSCSNCLAIRLFNKIQIIFYPVEMQHQIKSVLGLNLIFAALSMWSIFFMRGPRKNNLNDQYLINRRTKKTHFLLCCCFYFLFFLLFHY